MPDQYSRIFLLSHMRAFTSLAGHILGSHPQVNGYFEMHLSYTDDDVLKRQLEVLQESEALKAGSRYVFDKLLHNDYRLEPERLGDADIKILVALREPEQTIKSIVNLFAQRKDNEPYASPGAASNYYIERVQALAHFCREASQPYYYFDAALLQTAPDMLLPGLTQWLGLNSPLSEHYQVFSQTGATRKGDSSALIKSGKISQKRQDYSHIEIPDALLHQAQAAYSACRKEILRRAEASLKY